MASSRTIFHVDMDAFYASIEQRDHPEWRGRPLVVGSPPDRRGVVSAASYEARKFGIRSAMPSREAGRRCPDAIFAPVRMARYQEVSKKLMAILESFTPAIEPLSVDEAFLDMTGALHLHQDDPRRAAEAIRTRVREEIELTASVGIAPNKYLAKLASDLDKPDGLTLLPRDPDAIIAFLAPLPVTRVWGIGPKAAESLRKRAIHTIGDLQGLSVEQLTGWFGAARADHLSRLARGEDHRTVQTTREDKSVSAEHTFDVDTADADLLRTILIGLAERVGARLRKQGHYAHVVQIKFRNSAFQTATRQESLALPTHHDQDLVDRALNLFARHAGPGPFRLIGVGTSGLSDTPDRKANTAQPLLPGFDTPSPTDERKERLDAAVDSLRDKYGQRSIRRGPRA